MTGSLDEFGYGLHVRPGFEGGDIADQYGYPLQGPVKSRSPLQEREDMLPFHMRPPTPW